MYESSADMRNVQTVLVMRIDGQVQLGPSLPAGFGVPESSYDNRFSEEWRPRSPAAKLQVDLLKTELGSFRN